MLVVVVGEKKTEKERCVALMKQVPGNPSPVRRGIIERLPAGFSSTETYSMEGGGGQRCGGNFSSTLHAVLTMQMTVKC